MPLGSFRLNSISLPPSTPAVEYHILYTDTTDPSDAWYNFSVDSSGNYLAYYFDKILKFTSSGTVSWQKSISSGVFARVGGIDSSGNFLFVGDGPTSIELNGSTGSVSSTYSRTTTSGDHYLDNNAGIMSSSNNFYTGISGNDSNYRTIHSILRISDSNVIARFRWAVEYGSYTQSGGFRSMATAGSDDLYFTKYEGYNGRYYIVKYTGTSHQWSKRLSWSSSPTDRAHGISVGANGYVYGAGQTGYIWCLNSSQAREWEYSITGITTFDQQWSSTVDSSSNVYYFGKDGSGYGYILKLNSSGTQQWARRIYIGGNLGEFRVKIVNDIMYLSGRSSINGSNSNWIMKLPTDGTLTGNYGPSNVFQYSSTTITMTSINHMTVEAFTPILNDSQITLSTGSASSTFTNSSFNFAKVTI